MNKIKNILIVFACLCILPVLGSSVVGSCSMNWELGPFERVDEANPMSSGG